MGIVRNITQKKELPQIDTVRDLIIMLSLTIGALLYLVATPLLVDALTIEDLVDVHRGHLSTSQMERLVENFQDGTYASRHLQDYSDIIDELFANRNAIDRTVEAVYNGIVATTTSQDATVTDLIRTHVG